MRKKDDKLRNILLNEALKIALERGPDAINIREIAGQAGIAAGTVYNYFSCKDEIILTLTEDYWRRALIKMEREIQAKRFIDYLEQSYQYISQQFSQSGGALMNSLQNVEILGRKRMAFMEGKLHNLIVGHLKMDNSISDLIWSETFTPELYGRFILMNLMAHLGRMDNNIDFLIQIVERTLYQDEMENNQ